MMPWHKLTRKNANQLYREVITSAQNTKALKELCKQDLFFLLTVACKRKDVDCDWLYARCREVELNPDGYLDLWAREHYKSTIITFGLSIQDILKDPDVTIGIFSHTRPIAKGFLSQIKRELEDNTFLKGLFPEILYQDPRREAVQWSLDGGILVKRRSNAKENTIEAWGLVDGQPTSKHFRRLIYDDVVTQESVTTTDQIAKVTKAWELSLNLGARDGTARYIGTRYHFNDTYKEIMARGSARPRIRPATHNGKLDGDPVFLSREELAKKRQDMGPYTYSSQMLQDPTADKAMGFREEWLMYYDVLRNYAGWNFYLLVDPASKKKKTNDYTVMLVIGLAPDHNYYLVDGIRDRLNLTERAAKVFSFHRKWRPRVTGYEQYGLQADIEHIKFMQELDNYRFEIIELGGPTPKEDRIRKLVPIFEQKRFFLPHHHFFVDHETKQRDLVVEFVTQEFLAFPVSIHDDILDCAARIVDTDLNAQFPEVKEQKHFATDMADMGKVQTDFDIFK